MRGEKKKKKEKEGFGQRSTLFLMYQTDVEEGGETVFKHEGKCGESCVLRPPRDESPPPPHTHTPHTPLNHS